MPGERTEQATPHRREQARKEGDILHSRELTAAAGTLAGVLVLGMMGNRMLVVWRGAFAGFLDLGAVAHWEPATLAPTFIALRRLSLDFFAPAAVMMASIQTLLRSLLQSSGKSLAEIGADLNQALYQSSTDERYSTLFFGIISADRRSRRWPART